MKHLKLFESNAAYESFKGGDNFILPNVSYCKDGKLFYNPFVESVLTYNMVDLGLPSGLKWADRNIGAKSPEDYGLYFQWGDTAGYTADQVANGEKAFSSDWSDYFDTTDGGYTFNKYDIDIDIDKLMTLEASDDAATVHIGSDWRMPTEADMRELINNTTPAFIDLQGNEFSRAEAKDGAIAEGNLKGVRFTSKNNSNSIFIPASGRCYDSDFTKPGVVCQLWSSFLGYDEYGYAKSLDFAYNGNLIVSSDLRFFGNPVRGVHA